MVFAPITGAGPRRPQPTATVKLSRCHCAGFARSAATPDPSGTPRGAPSQPLRRKEASPWDSSRQRADRASGLRRLRNTARFPVRREARVPARIVLGVSMLKTVLAAAVPAPAATMSHAQPLTPFASAAEQQAAMTSGAVTSEALVRLSLDRI